MRSVFLLLILFLSGPLATEVNAQVKGSRNVATYTLKKLCTPILSRGFPTEVALWRTGRSQGYERRFQIVWDFYGQPKELTVEWTRAGKKQRFTTGLQTGRGSCVVTLHHTGNAQNFRITIKGPTNGGWEYSVTEYGKDGLQPIGLIPYPLGGTEPHRAIFGAAPDRTGNLYADAIATLQSPNVNSAEAGFVSATYAVRVPPGTRAFRVTTEPGAYLLVRQADPSEPCASDTTGQATKFSRRKTVDNVVSWQTPQLTPGWYQITASAINNRPPTRLKIDCFQTGHWSEASHNKKQGPGEVELILVGLESKTGADLQVPTGRLTLIAHGRTDSPRGKVTLGDAAGKRWESTPYYINWSQGSYSNDPSLVGLQGSRFVDSAAGVVAKMLADRGVRATNIDFIGHSWGAFIGWSLAGQFSAQSRNAGRKFHRFFALDPARIPLKRPVLSLGFQFWRAADLDFRNAATHSMTIHGQNDDLFSYGDAKLAQRADHNVFLFSTATDNGNLHGQPVKVMETLLKAPGGTKSSLLGAEVRLKILTVSGQEVYIDAEQGQRTVGDAVEYPRLFGQTKPGQNEVGPEVVPGAADIGESSVTLDYTGLPSFRFARTSFNGYLLSFSGDQLARLKSASVNTDETTLGLSDGSLEVTDSTLSINVSGLSYGPTSKARIDLQFDTENIPRAFAWLLDKEVNRSLLRWQRNGYKLPYPAGPYRSANYTVHLDTDNNGGLISMRYKDLNGQEVTLR